MDLWFSRGGGQLTPLTPSWLRACNVHYHSEHDSMSYLTYQFYQKPVTTILIKVYEEVFDQTCKKASQLSDLKLLTSFCDCK